MTVLSDVEIQTRLSSLKGWGLEGKEIIKKCKFKDFQEAMAFVLRVR